MHYIAFNLGMPRLWLPPKLLLIMKMIIIIMTTCLLQVSAATFAQKFTYAQKDASYGLVFKEIIKQTGYKILYSDQLLDKTKTINVNFKGAELKEVMETLLKNQPLTYEIDETTILIKEKAPTFLERLAERWASIDVSGRVVDAEGKALPGATVKVKATGKGVSTDVKGNFHLKNVEEGAVLVVSYTGYISKEVSASANMGKVVLEVSLSKLDEVQVIAYGTTTRRLSTGNISTVKAEDIEKQPVNNPLLALQGRVPGLFIEQATGFAGTGVKVRIQGQNSLNSGIDPFYVVDGVPYLSQLPMGSNPIIGSTGSAFPFASSGNPLNFINPSDIESIDILKDADATAIYGSRAANGAILITTKKGRPGDTRVNLNIQSGWARVPRKLDLMNSEQYLEMRREALKNDGIAIPLAGPSGDSDLNGNWDNTRYTDWQKELIGGTARYNDINTSISGGNGHTTFLIGGGYHSEGNVFQGDYKDKKASVHFNINSLSANQKFRIQFSGSYMSNSNTLPDIDVTSFAMTLSPVAPSLYDKNGLINWAPDHLGNTTFTQNPIGSLYNSFLNKTDNLTTNLMLSYEIIPGLNLKSSFGYNNLGSNITTKYFLQSWQPEYLPYAIRQSIYGKSNANSWSIEPQLNYNRSIGEGTLDAMLGATLQGNESNGSSIAATGFTNDLVMDDLMSATSIFPNSSFSSKYRYNAISARINYNWLDKYVINLAWRRDGSSRFGPESQFHDFASAGAGWIFTNEKIFKNALPFLSFGKLKGSYGTTGSDQIGDYKTLSLYVPISQPNPYQGMPVYQPNGLNNPYLEWEETRKLQFGIDLGFLNDRLLLNSGYFRNRSSNQLNGYSLPTTTGFEGIVRNQNYKIENSGFEISLSGGNFHLLNFSWSSSVNLTIPKSLLVDYPDIIKSSAASTAIIGKPLSAERVFHFLGVDPLIGIYQFADKNGNPTFKPNANTDKIVVLDKAPKFYGGFQNTFSYKSFQLDVFFSFVKQIGQNYSFGQGFPGGFFGGQQNEPLNLLNRWRQVGDIALVQRSSTGTNLRESLDNVYQSDAGWTDASYIRLKNVSVSWAVPEYIRKTSHLQSCSLFIQGQNLWTITGYSGLDPETKSSTSLPPLRVITVGVKIGI